VENMSLFKRKKDAGVATEKRQESAGGRNPHYEDLLEKEFGLHFRENGWVFEGQSEGNYAAQLSDPELCLALLRKLKPALGFNRICIIAASPILISCDMKPPFLLGTSLEAEGAADLVRAILKERPGDEVKEYQGTWMLAL
jgi:hypothetical protein